ncbi:glycoside hydrolase family 32 protein [Halobacillus mangrovi]|uniref:glycoside hydrolase family 32 protein n=1 Tax=Halobacillus mangrovi TaxID=402384 RepID=UPI003D95A9D6
MESKNDLLEVRKERYRPQFHYSPQSNWMNDPNGMVYFKGEYHLFYQYHPNSTKWGPMHWGHAVSEDLIHWEELQIAMAPDENGMIFSGCAVIDWENTSGLFPDEPGMVAIFTHADTYPDSDRPRQRQSIAYSVDQGRTWVKYKGNPVLMDDSITDFRDPKVFWHNETGHWVMVVAAGDHVRLYQSNNLIKWEFLSSFGENEGSHDGVWECPDLFSLSIEGTNKRKWAMIVSIGENENIPFGSRTQYFIGDFDGTHFVNDHDHDTEIWFDYGRDNYASVMFSNMKEHRRVSMGWMSNWNYANDVPTSTWRSSMTIPRVLSLVETENGLRINQQPVREVHKLRVDTHTVEQREIDSEEYLLPDSFGERSIEIVAEFEINSAEKCGLKVLKSEHEETIVGYDVDNKQVYVDRRCSGDSYFHKTFSSIERAPIKISDKKFKLHIFVDRSSVEVFANGGEAVITNLVFPKTDGSDVLVFAEDGAVKLNDLKIFHLKSIW